MNTKTPEPAPAKPSRLPLIGAVTTGFLASACCLGPLIALALGLGSASAFVALEPYRPLFAAITLGLLGWAAWQYRQGRTPCAAGNPSGKPAILWLAGALALLLLVAPWLLTLFAPASRT